VQVVALKTAAKLALQQAQGLLVGPQYQLIVFMGRMTHQKGCDIIAEVGAGAGCRAGGWALGAWLSAGC
jgi:glycogen synthase